MGAIMAFSNNDSVAQPTSQKQKQLDSFGFNTLLKKNISNNGRFIDGVATGDFVAGAFAALDA